jgi:hypothetical protein
MLGVALQCVHGSETNGTDNQTLKTAQDELGVEGNLKGSLRNMIPPLYSASGVWRWGYQKRLGKPSLVFIIGSAGPRVISYCMSKLHMVDLIRQYVPNSEPETRSDPTIWSKCSVWCRSA